MGEEIFTAEQVIEGEQRVAIQTQALDHLRIAVNDIKRLRRECEK
jgi:hypothetical protein